MYKYTHTNESVYEIYNTVNSDTVMLSSGTFENENLLQTLWATEMVTFANSKQYYTRFSLRCVPIALYAWV